MPQGEVDQVRNGIEAAYGTPGRDLAVELDPRVGFRGSAELKRAASGILACANARLSGGHVKSDALSPFSPGSICDVVCAKTPTLNGAAVVTRIRNDYVLGQCRFDW